MSIPKRPSQDDCTGNLTRYEHAVAKRAVEALRSIKWAMEASEAEGCYEHKRAKEALDQIEASGWVP